MARFTDCRLTKTDKKLKTIPYITLILFLSGCLSTNRATDSKDYDVLAKTSTAIVGTAKVETIAPSATITPRPSEVITVTPTEINVDPTYLVFETATATLAPIPLMEPITIVSPGPMSMLVSPIEFIVHLAPNYTGTTQIELVGEDGTELYRRIFKTYSNIGYYTRLDEKIDFEIRGVAELGRLQISTFDNAGRLQALNSTTVILQSVGENKLTPAQAQQAKLIIGFPDYASEIKGVSLIVKGEIHPYNLMPIIFELQNLQGKVISSRLLEVNNTNKNHLPFIIELPFNVTEKTDVRLIIRQSDDKLDGLFYLYSMPLFLSPP